MTREALGTLLARLEPLARVAARRVIRDRLWQEELASDVIWCAFRLAERGDERLATLARESDRYLLRWCIWRARDALRRHLRHAHEAVEAAEEMEPVALPATRCDNPGRRAAGEHLATDEELYEILRGASRASGGQVDACDLQRAYETAGESAQRGLRAIASGMAASEVGSYAYTQGARALRSAA